MASAASEDRLRTQVRAACGRIAGGAAAIVEAHRLGVPEGPHANPWTIEYHREAVHIYNESLPPWYQHELAVLFGHCAKTMSQHSIPARLAEDWLIVSNYLTLARSTILESLAAMGAGARKRAPTSVEAIADIETPPLVIRFDALARLTTSEGARRLQRAASEVRQQMASPAPAALDERQLKLLKRLADGTSIADIAQEMGYSQRSVYRAMAGLWKTLSVSGRGEGVQKAAAEGLLD